MARWRYLFMIGVLFFVFGYITWLGSVLIPFLKISCELNNLESYLIAFSFYISYFLLALPSAQLLKKTGYRKGMAIGLLLLALGTFIFIPAAKIRLYWIFLVGQFVQGSGLAILQTAANPYVVVLGPSESAAKRISIMGICNGIAGVLTPIILGSFILKDTDALKERLITLTHSDRTLALDELSMKVIMPYTIMTIILVVLSILMYFSSLPEIDPDGDDGATEKSKGHHNHKSILEFPHLLLGVFTLFLYVGVEVIAGDSIILYATTQGIALSTAKFFTSLTLSGMLIGYVIGIGLIPNYLSQEKALLYSAAAGIFFAAMAIFSNGYFSVACIALLGLSNALMYPAIWPLALNGLGNFTKQGASLLIMAIGGGAFLPLIYGRLADRFTPHQAYWMLIPCYITILYYAAKGHRLKKNQ